MSWTMRKRRRTDIQSFKQNDFASSRSRHRITGAVTEQSFSAPIADTLFTRIKYTEDVDRKVHPRDKEKDDFGGPFFSKELEVNFGRFPLSGATRYIAGTTEYWRSIDAIGYMYGSVLNPYLNLDYTTLNTQFDAITVPSPALSTYGARALNRVDPTRDKEIPDVGQFLIELAREGLPSLPLKLFSRVRNAKNAGGEYLNAVFGWKPLVSDVHSMLSLYLKLQAKLDQLRRDAGKPVRRKGTLYYDRTVTPISVTSGLSFGIRHSSNLESLGPETPSARLITWTVTETRVWFSGRGKYVLPIDLQEGPSEASIRDYLKLLSSNVSPSVVYEVLPWSWLIDWFSNLGDIVQQVAGHGVGTYTLDYCYLMRKHSQTTYYAVENAARPGWSAYPPAYKAVRIGPREYSVSIKKETKERIAATPFGFGLTLNSLSASQWAILTALGLSRQNFI